MPPPVPLVFERLSGVEMRLGRVLHWGPRGDWAFVRRNGRVEMQTLIHTLGEVHLLAASPFGDRWVVNEPREAQLHDASGHRISLGARLDAAEFDRGGLRAAVLTHRRVAVVDALGNILLQVVPPRPPKGAYLSTDGTVLFVFLGSVTGTLPGESDAAFETLRNQDEMEMHYAIVGRDQALRRHGDFVCAIGGEAFHRNSIGELIGDAGARLPRGLGEYRFTAGGTSFLSPAGRRGTYPLVGVAHDSLELCRLEFPASRQPAPWTSHRWGVSMINTAVWFPGGALLEGGDWQLRATSAVRIEGRTLHARHLPAGSGPEIEIGARRMRLPRSDLHLVPAAGAGDIYLLGHAEHGYWVYDAAAHTLTGTWRTAPEHLDDSGRGAFPENLDDLERRIGWRMYERPGD